MDELACNYDETATIDQGCEYEISPLVDCDAACLDGGVFYQFDIDDAYGDGMCCAYGEGSYSITVEGVEVGSGSDFGAEAYHEFCASADACVLVTFVADGYPGEQSWTMSADGVDVGAGDGNSAIHNFGSCADGCIDDLACNYDENADLDDGSCLALDNCGICGGDDSSCTGCADAEACNYLGATIDDESCTYADQFYTCGGDCINDTDGDGVCDELEVVGCVVSGACNYVDGVTDLITCIYPEPGYLCDGSCDGDADGDGVCDDNEIAGCTQQQIWSNELGQHFPSCNYDPNATEDDGSCELVRQHKQVLLMQNVTTVLVIMQKVVKMALV
jgi:hypothetical protein